MAGTGERVEERNEGIGVHEARHCLLCGREGTWLHRGLRDRLFDVPGVWALMRCPERHLAWLNPRPIVQDMGKLYERYFTHADTADDGAGVDRLPPRGGVARQVVKRGMQWGQALIGLEAETARLSLMTLEDMSPGTLLDVGSADGRFLHKMREAGWQVVGVETDPQAVRVARKRFAVTVHEGTLESAALRDGAFDAVTVSHVIEHVPDPIATLRECARVLGPRGRVVVVTPNLGSLGHAAFGQACVHLDPPRHLQLFSAAGLRYCAERAGLHVRECRTTARDARGIWAESRLIRRHGALPPNSPEKQRLRLRLEAQAFQIGEHCLTRAVDVGEEIVLVATK